jgi:hypothetical protein
MCTLVCLFAPQYIYEADEPQKTVSLEVVWNGDNVVDDNYGMTGKFHIHVCVFFLKNTCFRRKLLQKYRNVIMSTVWLQISLKVRQKKHNLKVRREAESLSVVMLFSVNRQNVFHSSQQIFFSRMLGV